VNTIQPMPHQVALDHQGFIVCVLGHLPVVDLQVNHQVAPPIVLLKFRDFEFGRHCHVGEPRHAREVCVLERV
jgi:hypothetical protein